MDVETLRANPVFHGDWYYSIELLPGMFTKGRDFANIELTRRLLKQVEIVGKRCLDIGIQDGLFTVLLTRRGARTVVGYDRQTLTPRLDLVRASLGIDFEYVSGLKLAELRGELHKRGHGPFDVVLFSGVLYHMFDPLAGLALVRSLVRNGGILLLETSCVMNDQMGMYFNAAARFYQATTYWQISVTCLDYLLRFLRLQALDCIYFLHPSKRDLPFARVCIACRAVDRFLPDPEDTWMAQPWGKDHDYAEFLDWEELVSNESSVPYHISQGTLVQRPSGESIDLYRNMQNKPEFSLGSVDRTLALSAKY